MKEKYTAYDTADYLDSEEDIKAFLNVCFESGDPEHITRALGAVARARGMTRIAKKAGYTRQSLYKALSSDGNPGFATVMKVMDALGIKLKTV